MELLVAGGGLIHICLCLLIFVCMRSGALKAPMSMFPLVACIPLWGALCVVAAEGVSRSRQKGRQTDRRNTGQVEPSLPSEEDRLPSSPAPSRSTKKEFSGLDVVPLEEAMLVNDPPTRRKLIMEVLRGAPALDLSMLKEVGFMGDTEVTHYATTVMVEMQEEFEADLLLKKNRWQSDPNSTEATEQYAASLQKYIESGLLEGSILQHRRTQYANLLDALVSQAPDDRQLFIQWADNRIMLGKGKETRRAIEDALQRWGADERLLTLSMRLNNLEDMPGALKQQRHLREAPAASLSVGSGSHRVREGSKGAKQQSSRHALDETMKEKRRSEQPAAREPQGSGCAMTRHRPDI